MPNEFIRAAHAVVSLDVRSRWPARAGVRLLTRMDRPSGSTSSRADCRPTTCGEAAARIRTRTSRPAPDRRAIRNVPPRVAHA